jgi:hypothetical protein
MHTHGTSLPYDKTYSAWLKNMKARVANITSRVYVTNVTNEALWDVYLGFLPQNLRQVYNCNKCKQFFNNYANLVYEDADGQVKSVFWDVQDLVPETEHGNSIAALEKILVLASPIHRFHSDTTDIGTAVAGGFEHVNANLPYTCACAPRMDADQMMAMNREDIKNITYFTAAVNGKHVKIVRELVKSGTLAQAELVEEQIDFLAACYKSDNKPIHKPELVKLVSKAHAGLLHPSASMVNRLIEGSMSGLNGDQIKERWNREVDPKRYQRPTAAPKAGNIERAEKLFAEMGLESALHRRFAAIEDLQQDLLWWPPKKVEAGGIFGMLRQDQQAFQGGSGVTMTFVKFMRTVLPHAQSVILHQNPHMFCPTTAVDSNSEPILQWDHKDKPNKVSWYTRDGGYQAHLFFKTSKHEVPAIALVKQPYMQDTETETHHGKVAFWLMEVDRMPPFYPALFPVYLKSELREVSSVIEAFNQHRQGTLPPAIRQHVAGLSVIGSTVKVTTNGVSTIYKIDRWD